MILKRYLFFVLAVIALSNAVKVNLQGFLGIGKDIMETIEYYVNKNLLSGRRSMSDSATKQRNDQIMSTVNAASLCEEYNFCDKNMITYLNEYVAQLAKSVVKVFDGILSDNAKLADENEEQATPIFINELKQCLRNIKKILKSANEKITDENEAYVWTEIVKKITAVFQNGAFMFLAERLEGKPAVILEIKKKLTQQLVISTILLERKFENQLCVAQNLCPKSVVCTKALNTVLEPFKEMEERTVKEFVTTFYEILPDTRFLSHLNDGTANEFLRILKDMAYSNNVSAKSVLLTIQRIVEDRLHAVESNTRVAGGNDVQLVHVILSDLDHFYSQGKEEPINNFLTAYFEWINEGSRLNASLRQVMRNIAHQIALQSEKLAFKLVNEVKVFLEIAVGPDN